MLDDIYPLFGWNEPVPTEFKEIFSKCVKKETEIGHDSNSRKCSSTLEESLIVDEDYEIQLKLPPSQSQQARVKTRIPYVQSAIRMCNWATHNCTQIISPSTSMSIPNAPQCANKNQPLWLYCMNTSNRPNLSSAYPQTTTSSTSTSKPSQSSESFTPQPKNHSCIQLIPQHLNKKKPPPSQSIMRTSESTSASVPNTLSPSFRDAFKQNSTSQMPISCRRVRVHAHSNSITMQNKQLLVITSHQNLMECASPCINKHEISIVLQLEEESIQLSIKSLQIILPSELTTSLIKQSPKSSPIIDSFLFSPKLNNFTPQVGPMQSRVRLQSFQLEETIQTPIDEWTEDLQNLEQIRGNVVNFVKTQHGSRLIQKYFTTCTQMELDQMLQEIGPHLPDLMIDPYANYMFGSLSQSCAPHQRLYILQTIGNRLVDIACDKKGTHAIQSLVSLISCKQEEEMVENSIKNNIIPLTLDSQGTHLIKKIIARFSEDRLNYIFHKLMDRFIQVVNHQFGLCVLKDLITKFKNNLEKSGIIINRMKDHLDEIIQDPFGNYGVQHVIDVYGDLRCNCIIDKILLKLIQLSIHKYSSNVVEKCILETSPKTQKRFIKQLSQDIICLELMKNKFGTFVLQKALQEADKLSETDSLQQALNRNLPSIYAQNIRQKWIEYLSKK